jgi:hypothetical protein
MLPMRGSGSPATSFRSTNGDSPATVGQTRRLEDRKSRISAAVGSCPADYVAVVCRGHERHRQRFNKVDTADHLVFDHAGHFADPVAMGSQTGLVVISRAALPGVGRVGAGRQGAGSVVADRRGKQRHDNRSLGRALVSRSNRTLVQRGLDDRVAQTDVQYKRNRAPADTHRHHEPMGESELLTTVRAATRACGVSQKAVRRWLADGRLGGPPWTVEQLMSVRDAPGSRARGAKAAHGTLTRRTDLDHGSNTAYVKGCVCPELDADCAAPRPLNTRRAFSASRSRS